MAIRLEKANDDPILDARLCEVEHLDGHKAALSANTIAESLMAQVDSEGHQELLMEEIIGHCTDGNEAQESDAFVVSKNDVKRRVQTTVGWEINMLWRDGSTIWSKLKDAKEWHPVQVAECTVANSASELPAFQWWVPYTIKKRDCIIAKTRTSYGQKTHKHGLETPKDCQDCIQIDTENDNRSWQDAVRNEMTTARPAFETYEIAIQDLIGHQKITCHLIFDVKLGKNFRRKAWCVAGGHTTRTPSTLTNSSVVSRDSVRIALTAAALNDLDILACDIEGASPTAKCQERIYVKAGPEFGSEQDSIMIVKMALHGLKSLGAAFRSKLAGVLDDLGHRLSYADPDAWLKAATKPDGFTYYEMVLVCVDDVMVISHVPGKTIEGISSALKLNGDKAAPPDMHLGVSLKLKQNSVGTKCWSVSPEKHVAASVHNTEEKLAKEGQ
jgi:hypothetical protein